MFLWTDVLQKTVVGCPSLFFVNTNTKSKSKRSIAGPTFLLKGSVLYCDDFKFGKRFVVHLKTTDAAFQVPCISIILGCHSHIRMRLIQPITAHSFLTKKKMFFIKTAGFQLKWDGNASFFKNALKIATNTSRLNQFSMVWIGHFRVALSLCFKARLSAKLLID